jgi:DNA-binding LacI/PurR family transcriptional regulator
MAPAQYEGLMKKFQVKGFFVNDLLVDDRRLQALLDRAVPYVAMGRPMRTAMGHTMGSVDKDVVDDDRHPYVENDNRAGIARMVQLLRDAGCHTFAHLRFAFDGSVVPHDRMAAVKSAVGKSVEHLSIPYDKIDVEWPTNVRAVADWLNTDQMVNVDAVICDSDRLADILRSAARNAGRRLVRDLGTAASGDWPLMTCGNDDNPVRRTGGPESTWWMTMHSNRTTCMQKTVDVMASRLQAGSTAPTSVLVPPIIVGAPDCDPTEETKIDG